MQNFQPGILDSVPRLARYLTFSLIPGADPRAALQALAGMTDGNASVVGLGQSLTLALGMPIDGLKTFPVYAQAAIEVPSTPFALWVWLRGDDRGELLHRSRAVQQALSGAFQMDHCIDAFQYGPSLDLTGYEDGTENPKDDEALATAIVQGRGVGLDGSSFVAVQQWQHDLDRFESMNSSEQDATFGRRKSDNGEITDAPASAHVKRTAQEDFEPEAFVLRRSMPWADASHAGLVFVAFGKSFDAFDALLNRMVGNDDGIPDALFSFTRPSTGSYFWCPPLKDGQLDLSLLGL